jgi:hypothetical protein
MGVPSRNGIASSSFELFEKGELAEVGLYANDRGMPGHAGDNHATIP